MSNQNHKMTFDLNYITFCYSLTSQTCMSPKKNESRVRKVDIFTIEMREDGIVRVYAEADEVVDMQRYQVMIRAIGELTQGQKVPVLGTAGELTIPDEAVRKYIAEPDSNPYCKVLAMVAPSLSQKILANIHARSMANKRPTQLFRTEDEAIQWLKEFL